MAKILVNYIYNKATDEYKLCNTDCVFADMKVAILETEDEIKNPLVVPIQNRMTVVDRDLYEQTNKRFCLVADSDGNVYEDQKGINVWLPKNTDVTKLRLVNGQLVMVEEEEQPTVEEVKEEKPKKPKKEGIKHGN